MRNKTPSFERLVAKMVARLAATAALWVRIQTSLKNKIKTSDISERSDQHTLVTPPLPPKKTRSERKYLPINL